MTGIDHFTRCSLGSLGDGPVQLEQHLLIFAVFGNFRIEDFRPVDEGSRCPGILVGRLWRTARGLQHATLLAGTLGGQITQH